MWRWNSASDQLYKAWGDEDAEGFGMPENNLGSVDATQPGYRCKCGAYGPGSTHTWACREGRKVIHQLRPVLNSEVETKLARQGADNVKDRGPQTDTRKNVSFKGIVR